MMRTLIVAGLLLALAGCANSPTRETRVMDQRPGLSFSLGAERFEDYELKIDGISYGSVGQYREGDSLLRIVSGTHEVELLSAGRVVFSREVYLGGGATKVVEVNAHD